MHEYSVVSSLLALCEEQARAHNAASVTKVMVKIGKLSGIEPHLLESAFETFKEKSICARSRFEMQLQNVVIACNGCGKETELEELFFKCPECGSVDVRAVDGEDMVLMRLEME